METRSRILFLSNAIYIKCKLKNFLLLQGRSIQDILNIEGSKIQDAQVSVPEACRTHMSRKTIPE
jgi:hypothetical protein